MMNENEWEDLECLLKPTITAITGGDLSQTLAIECCDDENGYEMKKA